MMVVATLATAPLDLTQEGNSHCKSLSHVTDSPKHSPLCWQSVTATHVCMGHSIGQSRIKAEECCSVRTG